MTDDDYEARLKALGVPAKARPVIHSIFVTISADNKVHDLEQAMQRMLVAEGEAAKDAAYAHLNACRKALYAHIEELEAALRVPRSVRRRF